MNVYVFDIGSICNHGKELFRKFTLHQNTVENLTLKQMVEIPEQLILEQSDEINGVTPINWEDSSWKHLSVVSDEEVLSLSHANVYEFSDSVLCLGKVNQNPTLNTAWNQQLDWFKDSSQYRTLDAIDGEPMEFEWNIFPGFTTLQLVHEVQQFMNKMGEPEQFQGRSIFMSLFNDIFCGSRDNKRNIFPGFTTLQLLFEVQKFMNEMSDPEQFQGRIIFMSMFNDIIW